MLSRQKFCQRPGVPFFAALKFWLRLGFISFGGPAGQIAIMHRELVDEGAAIAAYPHFLPSPAALTQADFS